MCIIAIVYHYSTIDSIKKSRRENFVIFIMDFCARTEANILIVIKGRPYNSTYVLQHFVYLIVVTHTNIS